MLKRDRVGNLLLRTKSRRRIDPVIFTAHLDHPAFVVREVLGDRELRLEFRGGINAAYFKNGRVLIYDAGDRAHPARIVAHEKGTNFDEVLVRLVRPSDSIALDDVATWDIKPATVRKGRLHAPACDDLAGVAAALSALDILRRRKNAGPVGVLLTRAEEVGFVGAIEACEAGFIPSNAKVIALENSRSFPESPIGGGPIVRVGDRISVFHHGLLYAVSQIADQVAKKDKSFVWQRKLMPGGACEATTFQAYGCEAICLCLPLGNYHNMGEIDRVLNGVSDAPAKAAAEFVSVADYHGLVRLLIECGLKLGDRETEFADGARAILDRMREIRRKRGFVLDEKAARIR